MGLSIWQILLVIFFIYSIWASIRVIHKAGYSGWWVLITFVPIVNFIMIWVFAFADWPNLRYQEDEPAAIE
ncbi:DUF805 domain-containing protein [Emcibacter sp.]|uniref:DUF805 domain-containing protein n=1 Tax=Emcibacter sp. TaxID=1979954 RepID=UPI003A909BE8